MNQPMTTNSTFVLVHGAFRGGWAWQPVADRLRAAGHRVFAPSLIGCGELAAHVGAVTSLSVWVDQVTELLVHEDLHHVVLVGHSQAGLITPGVAERVPGRIAALVHLDAAVPVAGQSAVDLTGAPSTPPRWAVLPAGSIDRTSGEFDQATAAHVQARLTPSPVAPALDPVGAVPPHLPQHHIFCARTPPGYPAHATRARLETEGVEHQVLDAFHDAPLSAPDLITHALMALAPGQTPAETTPMEAHR